jgi:hypothetical protein
VSSVRSRDLRSTRVLCSVAAGADLDLDVVVFFGAIGINYEL